MSDFSKELDISISILEKKMNNKFYQHYRRINTLQAENISLKERILKLERGQVTINTQTQEKLDDIYLRFNKISNTLKYLENLCLFIFQTVCVSIFCSMSIAQKFWIYCSSEFQTFSFYTLPEQKKYKNLKDFIQKIFENRKCCFVPSRVYDWSEHTNQETPPKKQRIVNLETLQNE